jgi:hypothetical protein
MCSIIQRAGIIPLSIAGIFKEVTTISISAIVFGDQLTEVNMIGVLIAVIGKSPSAKRANNKVSHYTHITNTKNQLQPPSQPQKPNHTPTLL